MKPGRSANAPRTARSKLARSGAWQRISRSLPAGATLATLARFRSLELPVEVFGQAVPVDQQRGYRHLLVEARFLELGGPRLRRAILELREEGLKTEPAFARALGLSGDPYERLWALSWCDDAELRAILGASDT